MTGTSPVRGRFDLCRVAGNPAISYPTGDMVYVQLKSGNSYTRQRQGDGAEVFGIKNPDHIDYWQDQPCCVFLVIANSDWKVRWMNITRYLRTRADKQSRQVIFDGRPLDAGVIKQVCNLCLTRRDRKCPREHCDACDPATDTGA